MKRIVGFIGAGLGMIGILVGVHVSRLSHGELVVDFLDVGQGDAVLITTPENERILIDGGPEQFVLEELGAVIPFLSRRIDLVILTHPHADHVMGLVQVLKRYEVEEVLFTGLNYWSPIYDEFLKEAREQGVPLRVAQADQDFTFGEVELDVLFPFESMLGETIENVNNGSVVVMVSYGEHRILLTGDAEREVELDLVEYYEEALQSALLKAGHHGSKTASSPEFLEFVEPSIVIIQVGEDNSFGHPHEEALEQFLEVGVHVYRNDLDGRVRFRFDSQNRFGPL